MKSTFHAARPPLLAVALALGAAGLAGLGGCATQAASAPQAAPATTTDEARRFHAMLEAQWEWSIQNHPEFATWVGDRRGADRLDDNSAAARAAQHRHEREWLAQLNAVQRDALGPQDRLSLDIARYQAGLAVEEQAHVGLQLPALHPLFGVHALLPALFQVAPAQADADFEAAVQRMAAYPLRVDQEIERLREGNALGWRKSRPVVERVIASIEPQLVDDPRRSPVFEPFTRPTSAEVQQRREQWTPKLLKAIEQHVVPAQRRLRDFLAHDCLPGAPAVGAMLEYPGGPEAYRYQVKENTTTDLAPQQIHEIGLKQLARLRAEMDEVRRTSGFQGDFSAFVRFLNSDKRFFVDSEEALLMRFRDAAKRVEPELPRLFVQLPRAPLGVRAYPAFMGPNAAASYTGPSQDGSRAGWFSVPAVGFAKKPVWSVESLAAHEGVPGHHLQTARAIELNDLPKFRRGGGFVAFNEGWALYAETLGFDLGLYKDPYSRFGHLQMQAFRAARLVVDTGLHAKGWTRQQAIDFMVDQTGMNRDEVSFEVDRYISTPAQALGYMIGELKIMELRDRAKARLGDRFDVRRFHNAVIDNGSLPLAVLERQIDEWIAAQ